MNKPMATTPTPQRDATELLIESRKSFRIASQSFGVEEIELHAKQRREFLRLAHEAAELKDSKPSFWRKVGLPNG
jgi:hypothetical protein